MLGMPELTDADNLHVDVHCLCANYVTNFHIIKISFIK